MIRHRGEGRSDIPVFGLLPISYKTQGDLSETAAIKIVDSDAEKPCASTGTLTAWRRGWPQEIFGERTPAEERYDKEVVRWLGKGKSIKKAIAKANQKVPSEALSVNDENSADVEAHYEYLAEHESIMRKVKRM